MQFTVMGTAKRHRIFVAHFETEASWLRKPEVVGVGWLTPANHTGLRGNELAVTLVAPPTSLWRNGVIFKSGLCCRDWVGRRGPFTRADFGCLQGRTSFDFARCGLPTSTAEAIPGLGKFDLKRCFNLARVFGR